MYKYISIFMAVTILSATAINAQGIPNAKTTTVKVYGNCGMCETTIEKAAFKKKVSKADWNEQTKMATITYDAKKTNADAVLKSIALAGYDSETFLAPDAAYDKLPGCCKYERVKKQNVAISKAARQPAAATDPHAGHNHGASNAGTSGQPMPGHAQHSGTAAPAAETGGLTQVFSHYFSLKDALVKTDAATAASHAKALGSAIAAVNMNKLDADVHTVWMKVLPNLKKSATQISTSKEVAKQRTQFKDLSESMYALAKAGKPTEAVYYQHCPMAFDGKGANWLSKEMGVKNPYYGANMLTCGSTIETIKK